MVHVFQADDKCSKENNRTFFDIKNGIFKSFSK